MVGAAGAVPGNVRGSAREAAMTPTHSAAMKTLLHCASLLLLLVSTARAQSFAYEQPMVAGGGVPRNSQLWVDPGGGNDSDNDSICWEDFEFPVDTTITKLRWWGQSALPLGFEVSFFHQDPNTISVQPDLFAAGSHPISEQVYTNVSQIIAGGGMYRFEVDLAAPLSFLANTRYFVSIVALTPSFPQQWSWAEGSGGVHGTFWWIRGAHMYFHTPEDRAVSLATASGWPVGQPSCFGDGLGAPCPCANSGAPGAGCANSAGTGGMLAAFGTPSVAQDTVVLAASHCPPGTSGLFFGGPNAFAGQTFGDGLRCVGGALIRLQVVSTGPTGAVDSQVAIAANEGLIGGELRHYQYWYRDVTGPCGTGFNATNAVSIQW